MKHERALKRRRIEAEEDAVLDIQYALLDILRERGISKEEFARRLGVSKASVSQLFAAGANPTVKRVARLFDALEATIEFHAQPIDKMARKAGQKHWEEIHSHPPDLILIQGVAEAANENFYQKRVAA